jgi:ribokinase
MKNNEILVIGSSNTDMVIKTARFPRPGETILGGDFFMNQGGKGANQAVTVARLKGEVNFICKTGNDLFREQSLNLFKEEGMNTEWILTDEEKPSGIALIMVDEEGENSIVVASGANGNLTREDIDRVVHVLDRSEYVLLQLEIPLDTVEYVIRLASQKQKKVILNPAPAAELPETLFGNLYMVTPNRIEAEHLSGMKIKDTRSLENAAKRIHDRGVQHVIITLGEEGVLIYNGQFERVPSEKTDPIDTTGAGDVFNGALCVALSEGESLSQAVQFANKAAAISITKYGAIPSIPRRDELAGNV